MTQQERDILEDNVSTLLEGKGRGPSLSPAARARIRAALIARHAAPAAPRRWRAVALGAGVLAAAAAAVIALRGGDDRAGAGDPLGGTVAAVAGAEVIRAPGAEVTVLAPRRLRVVGAALIDVEPGKGAFVVETAHGQIEVLGTRFLVDGSPDQTTAAVVRGEVRLASASGEVVLHAGEQAVAAAGRAPVRGPAPRLSHLVSWAREARARQEHAPAVHHGTLFARDPIGGPGGPEVPLPIARLGVDVVIEGQVARVALDQTFRNATPRTLEGMYRFAIPPDAALQRLAMYVDGKLTESAVVERMAARRVYEQLVYRQVDPALLEWAGTGRLALRVYPLPPMQDKRLMLAYTQSLPRLYRDYTLTVPLPEVDEPVGALDVTVRLAGCANCELSSPSHAVTVARAGDDAVVTARRAREQIGDSFVLRVRDARGGVAVARAARDGERFVRVRVPDDVVRVSDGMGGAGGPGLAPGGGPGLAPYRPRSWVLLDDVSASRSPLELRAQADLIDRLIRELDEQDRVAVVAFDVAARVKLAPTRVVDVDRKALRAALAREGGVGATDLGVGLAAATAQLAGVPADDARVVYLGDGVVTGGARQLDVLRAALGGKAQFIGVGVGDGPDTQTLSALAEATGGYATTIDLADDLGWRAFDLVATLHTARVTGLSARLLDARGQPVAARAYLRSPQLADGEEVELVAQIDGAGEPAAVELAGTLRGAPWRRTIALGEAAAGDAGYLPRLWAQRHVAARLLAKHEPVAAPPCAASRSPQRQDPPCPTQEELREQRDEAIRREVIALGKRYFLLSRHTSLLVLENDAMYAEFGVTKGDGATWAPYAMPATIPVVALAAAPPPVDGELVRAPVERLYGEFAAASLGEDEAQGVETRDAQRFDRQPGDPPPGDPALVLADRDTRASSEASAPAASISAAAGDADKAFNKAFDDSRAWGRLGLLSSGARGRGPRFAPLAGQHGGHLGEGYGAVRAARLTRWDDAAFDDLTVHVPALFPGPVDRWRAVLARGAAPGDAGGSGARPAAHHTLDPRAAALLVAARRGLAPGVYRWGELELAVDAAGRLGWRRTTDAGLRETASFDGAAWQRRYPELGLAATRAVRDDDVALSLAVLPIWIAEPAHYAAWFDVALRGDREVVLSRAVRGTRVVELVLRFDDRARLTAITDGAGAVLVEVTWADGPAAARVQGAPVAVGFTAATIADAPAWAHGAPARGDGDADALVEVELPARVPAYWERRRDAAAVGSAAWRHAQRQRLVSLAATGAREALWPVIGELRAHGEIALGELVLASGGIEAAAPGLVTPVTSRFAAHAIGRYWQASSRASRGARPVTDGAAADGFLGALGLLRQAVGAADAGRGAAAVDAVAALVGTAPVLALVGAAALSEKQLPARELARAWLSVAVGDQRNVARAGLARALFERGDYDAGAERVAALIDDLDLAAAPPRLTEMPGWFHASRRGEAGWKLLWSRWRDRVLASERFDHVWTVLVTSWGAPDLAPVVARAVSLAGGDATRLVAIARWALSRGDLVTAETALRPIALPAARREVLQLRGELALRKGALEDALRDLAAAQDAPGETAVELTTVRAELAQLLGVARTLAVRAEGPARQPAIERALAWGARWRAVDPGNLEIDRQLGALMLELGDAAEAWRQLSTAIERDPWSGAGYTLVAEAFERQGKLAEALPYWQLAVVIDQTNPTPRLRKAQTLIALGRAAEGDALLAEVVGRAWHPRWSWIVAQARALLAQGKRAR